MLDKKTVDSEQQTVRIRQGKTDPVECEIVIEFPEHGGHVPEGGMSELNAHQGPFFNCLDSFFTRGLPLSIR